MTVHLYGPKAPPGWVQQLPLQVKFAYHNDRRLFKNDPVTKGLGSSNEMSIQARLAMWRACKAAT